MSSNHRRWDVKMFGVLRVYMTRVHANIEGDAWFPALDEHDWVLVAQESHEADDVNEHAFEFRTYERRS